MTSKKISLKNKLLRISYSTKTFLKDNRQNLRSWRYDAWDFYKRGFSALRQEKEFYRRNRLFIRILLIFPLECFKELPGYFEKENSPKEISPDRALEMAQILDVPINDAMDLMKPPPPPTLTGPTSPWDNPDIEFSSFRGIYNRHGGITPSFKRGRTRCGFRIERKPGSKEVKVVLSQVPHSTGPTVNHMFEKFATDIFWLFLFRTPVENIEWYDYWPPDCDYHGNIFDSTFQKVTLKWNGTKFFNPCGRNVEIPEEWKEKKETKTL